MPKTHQKRTRNPENTRERITEAAGELFLAQGYSNTSLDDVAAQAGVTKPTVYSYFHSKEGLFESVVQAHAGKRLQLIEKLNTPSGNPRDDLMDFGTNFLKNVLNRQTRCWDRLAAAETMTHPEVGRLFFQAGPQQLLNLLANYLESEKKAGRLDFPDAPRAAEQLIGLLLGVDILRSFIGQPTAQGKAQQQRCREAVDVFLAAYEVKS